MDQASLASIHESKTLAGIFQHIVDDCRGLTPVIDDFLGKSSKLAASLRSTVLALSSFLDSLHKIAERAANTKGSSRDLGACLTKVYIRHRAVEAYLNTFASSMTDGLFVPLKAKNEDFRRKVSELDRDHLKEFKKVRSEIKRKIELIHKLRRKSRKESSSNGEIVQQIEQQTRELYIKYRVLEEQERQAVRRINMEERAQFCGFAACLKPVLSEELTVMAEIENIGEVVDSLATIIRDPHVIPDTTDQVIQEIITSGNAANYSFATPPSSPGESLFSSRCGSLKSISSLVNSRTSSPASLRSTEAPPVILRSSNSASNNNPKNRLSSISMQSAGEERGRVCPSPSFYSEDEGGGGGRQGRERQSRPARPNSTCELYSRFRGASSSPSRHCRDQPFSTVKRTHSPFRRAAVPDNQRPGENYVMSNGQTTSPLPLSPPPMQGQRHSNSMSQHDRRDATSPPTQSVLSRRPPLPRKLQTGGEVGRQTRTTDSMEVGQDTGPWQLLHIEDDEPSSFTSPWSPPPATSAPCWTPSSSSSPWSPPPSSTSSHADYAAPRCLRPLRLPDFTPARQDMVVPQPMTNSSWEDEDELQTPTVEEQNFPDSKVEDTVSTVSSTSSGYGSQQRESDGRWPARARQQPVSSLHWTPPASSHLWSEAIMARKLADLGSTRLSRQTSVSSEDRPRGLSLNNHTERARATLGRSLSFAQPGITSSCRLSRLETGRRSTSLVDRKVEERQKERDSVLQLLNLRLGGRPGQGR